MEFNCLDYVDTQERNYTIDAYTKRAQFKKYSSKLFKFDYDTFLRNLELEDTAELFPKIATTLIASDSNKFYKCSKKIGLKPEDMDCKLIRSLINYLPHNQRAFSLMLSRLIESGVITEYIDDRTKTIKTKRLGDISFSLRNPDGCTEFLGQCHDISHKSFMQVDNISLITGITEFSTLDKGYHSVLETKDSIADISLNLIWDKNSFYKINNFKVLNKVSSRSDYKSEYLRLSQQLHDEFTYPPLLLAAYKEFTNSIGLDK